MLFNCQPAPPLRLSRALRRTKDTEKMMRAASFAALAAIAAASTCTDNAGKNPGPCMPGHEQCGTPFSKDTSPAFHLMDQHGCGENDPNVSPAPVPRAANR